MSIKDKIKTAVLPCAVSPGMFSTERHVIVKLPDGREIDALVDRQSVLVEEEPQAGKPQVKGFVTVSIVNDDKHANRALVDLPEGSFSKGPRIQIPSNMVERRK